MSCIHTGARILFLDYGKIVPSDLYRVANALIIRVYPEHFAATPVTPECPQSAIDYTVTDRPFEVGFWRPDLGIFVVPEEAVRATHSEAAHRLKL